MLVCRLQTLLSGGWLQWVFEGLFVYSTIANIVEVSSVSSAQIILLTPRPLHYIQRSSAEASQPMANDNASSDSISRCFPPNLPWLVKLQVRLTPISFSIFLRQNTTLNRTLVNLCVGKTPSNPTNPIKGLNTHDIPIQTNDLSFRLFTPLNSTKHGCQKLPLIIYIHGGGFILQTAESPNCHTMAAGLSLRLPAVVASLTYRLAPEHQYPSQHQDVHDMITFLDAHPHLFPKSTDLSNTFLVGDSAGANLAHFAAAKFSSSSSKESLVSINLKGVILIQPFFGGEERTESEMRLFHGPVIPVWVTDWMWRAYLPDGADRDHAMCNVSGPNAVDGKLELDGFPRSLVVVTGYDPLQDWQRRYCQWLRRWGKEVEVLELDNGIHGFYIYPELDETRILYEQVANFVRSQVDAS